MQQDYVIGCVPVTTVCTVLAYSVSEHAAQRCYATFATPEETLQVKHTQRLLRVPVTSPLLVRRLYSSPAVQVPAVSNEPILSFPPGSEERAMVERVRCAGGERGREGGREEGGEEKGWQVKSENKIHSMST